MLCDNLKEWDGVGGVCGGVYVVCVCVLWGGCVCVCVLVAQSCPTLCYPMESSTRGRFEGGGFMKVLCLIHVDIWQKPTQYCKSIILQFKINIFF